jgi:hypothetical protein
VVGNLVVGEEGAVHDRSPRNHVADDGRDLEVELDHGRKGAHERVDAGARDPRLHVAPALLARRPALAHDLGKREDESAGDRVGLREVGGVVTADRAPPVQDRAHRQHRVPSIAREDVRSAGAVRVQEPAPIGMPAFQLLGVARVVGDDRRVTILLPPSECGHVVVVAVQQPGLAGAGLGRPVGLPAGEPVAPLSKPARQGGGVPVAHRPPEDLVGEPVDLAEDDAGNIGLCAVSAPPCLAADYVAIPGLVLVDREQGGEQGGERRQPEGDHDRLCPAGHMHAREHRGREADEDAIENQRRPTEGEHAER